MQLATVEFARNVLGLEGAHSAELDPDTPYPVIDLLPEQKDIEELGGTLRLGLYPSEVKEGTLAYDIYGKKKSKKDTVIVMSLITTIVNRWKKVDLYSQV